MEHAIGFIILLNKVNSKPFAPFQSWFRNGHS